MAEHDLELRLRAVACALDADAPAFDVAVLRAERRRRGRQAVVALAAVAVLAGLTVAPSAVSALGDLFGVDAVPELGPVAPDVAPPFLGRRVAADTAQAAVPFRVRTIPLLGPANAVYTRDDVAGGMVSVAYAGGRILLTQWPASGVDARIAVVPLDSTAAEVPVGRLRALWIAGTARGTFTLVGADGAVHRELFEVAEGALLWEDGGGAFLLQGAGTRANAVQLASSVLGG